MSKTENKQKLWQWIGRLIAAGTQRTQHPVAPFLAVVPPLAAKPAGAGIINTQAHALNVRSVCRKYAGH